MDQRIPQPDLPPPHTRQQVKAYMEMNLIALPEVHFRLQAHMEVNLVTFRLQAHMQMNLITLPKVHFRLQAHMQMNLVTLPEVHFRLQVHLILTECIRQALTHIQARSEIKVNTRTDMKTDTTKPKGARPVSLNN
jgi:hypothetical protein